MQSVAPDIGKLRWRCRRGMKELDLLLTRYVDTCYGAAAAEEQAAFRELLNCPDPVLHAYVMGTQSPTDPELLALLRRVTLPPPNER